MVDRHEIEKGLKIKSNGFEQLQRLYGAKVRLLYKNAPIGIAATLINSLILVFVLWGVVPHGTLLIWFSAIAVIIIFRVFITFKYMRLPGLPPNAGFWDTLSFISFTASGIVWGAAGIFLFPSDSIAYQAFLTFVLGGMVAGTAGAFSVILKYFFGYSLPAMIPILIRLLIIGDDIHLAMGGMAFLFGILMYFTAKYINDVTISSMELRFENIDLIDHLVAEKGRIEKLNEDYKTEINERKQTERRLKATLQNLEETKGMLAQSEKLAVIGRLASAIGHEVLNPLNIINMRLQIMNQDKVLSEEAIDAIRVCKEQINRIVKIIRNIGQFSRSGNQDLSIFTPAGLDEVINYALNLYEPEFKEKNIRTEVEFHEGLPLVSMDREKIAQVLFNIISNSIDTMTDKPERILRIKTLPGSSSDELIQIVVSDTGTGIDNGDLEKIIDPFFTTKDPGKGSGLGLYMSYITIKNHGGNIWAENNESGGVSIFIELPIEKTTINTDEFEN